MTQLKRNLTVSKIFAISLVFFLPLTGCNSKTEVRHGAGQQASVREQEEQNHNLINQVVIATEELEKHPDPTFLRNAVARLNSWLEKKPELKDFQPDPQLEMLSGKIRELGLLLAESGQISAKFLAEPKVDVSEKDGEDLILAYDKIRAACSELQKLIPSALFPALEKVATDCHDKLVKSKEYQFGNRVDMFRSAIAQFKLEPWCQFPQLAEGFDDYAELLKTGKRAFHREDADYLKQAVWLRNIAHWAKGDKQEDIEIVKNLFDWTVKNIIISDLKEKGPLGPIPQTPWQTILLSHGSPMERADVFMELLRQVRLDSFIIRPLKDIPNFPILIGVRIENNVYLFLPELGLPVPGKSGLKLDKGLEFTSIATLKDVLSDDALLRQLDISEKEKFPLTSEQLKEVVALVPTSPFSLAERMSIIEQEFSGNIYTVLATSWPTQKERIAALGLFKNVDQSWHEYSSLFEQVVFPVESQHLIAPYLFTMKEAGNLNLSVQGGKTEEQDDGTQKKSPLRNTTNMNSPLWIGKILYFKGRFTDENGAAHWLQQGRVSDRILKQTADNLQGNVNEFLNKLSKDSADKGQPLTPDQLQQIGREYVIAEQQSLFAKKYIKVAARFYLALVSLSAGNNDTAITHLNDSSLLSDLGGYWQLGTLYLIARIDENKGEYKRAAGILSALKGTYTYGNRLRASWINKLAPTEKSASPEAKPQPEQKPQSVQPVKSTDSVKPKEAKKSVKTNGAQTNSGEDSAVNPEKNVKNKGEENKITPEKADLKKDNKSTK